jgi:hypothetical protein
LVLYCRAAVPAVPPVPAHITLQARTTGIIAAALTATITATTDTGGQQLVPYVEDKRSVRKHHSALAKFGFWVNT